MEPGTEGGCTDVSADGLVTTDRTSYDARNVVEELWAGLNLRSGALSSIRLEGDSEPALPSSFRIGVLAQASIALSALAAAQIYALRNEVEVPQVKVPLQHAVVEFKSERFYTIDGHPPAAPENAIGGLHRTADGYIRVHDSFANHSKGILDLVGLPLGSTRHHLAHKIAQWRSLELEDAATIRGSLAQYGLSANELAKVNPNIVKLNMLAMVKRLVHCHVKLSTMQVAISLQPEFSQHYTTALSKVVPGR
ncbi:CoA-transferase family III [Aureobasidium sp. EXF-10728]|nr:CoA-transferase family III [Aureobasidium sp. EXF-10728]